MKIAEMTNGFSGAEVSAVVNTAISLVLHEYLQKFPSPEEGSETYFRRRRILTIFRRGSQKDKETKRNKTRRANCYYGTLQVGTIISENKI